MPKRIQRRRTKGWRMPPNTVYVGRGSRWGNPYVFGQCNPDKPGRMSVMVSASALTNAFRGYAARCIESDPSWIDPLRGKDLACWCPLDQPCHADVLIELANAPENSGRPGC
jgi:hypothetical protein